MAINLAPADLPKEGALLDLPMAVGIAVAMGEAKPPERAILMGSWPLMEGLERQGALCLQLF